MRRLDLRPDLIFYRFARFLLVTVFCGVWLRTTYEGRENVPASGAYVVAPVHRSNLDTLIVGGLSSRRLRFMGKDSLWKTRFFGAVFSALGAFPVHRGSADREALRRSLEVLKGGEPLVVFPEGTRQSGPVVQPLFEGAAYLAARAGVPIIPVGIGGSEAAMPKGSKMIHPVKVHVVVGRPILPPDGRGSGEGGAGPEPDSAAGGRPDERPTPGRRVARAAVHDLTTRLHGELQELFDAASARC